jgi:protein SCO1/2
MKRKNVIAIVVILVAFFLFFRLVYQPYAEQQNNISRMADDLKPSELLRDPLAAILAFEGTDQQGETFTDKDVEGFVHVTDFFFTSCDAICPMMTSQLSRVQEAMGDEENYRIVSFSLDPENDSLPVLRSFARKFGAKESVWHLLTGNKDDIYEWGREGYKQAVLIDSNGVINHSPRFVLVDENKMIRGFYNGLDSVEVDLLINDLSFLLYKKK